MSRTSNILLWTLLNSSSWRPCKSNNFSLNYQSVWIGHDQLNGTVLHVQFQLKGDGTHSPNIQLSHYETYHSNEWIFGKVIGSDGCGKRYFSCLFVFLFKREKCSLKKHAHSDWNSKFICRWKTWQSIDIEGRTKTAATTERRSTNWSPSKRGFSREIFAKHERLKH